jgi:Flp pilus assembly protein TadG
MPKPKRATRSESGSAIADFALVSVILIPLFFAIFQLALIWHVKSTLTAAASEGARYGSAYNRTTEAGRSRTEQVLDQSFGADFDDKVLADTSQVEGQQVVEVTVTAEIPVLAFWGPTVTVHTTGHAIKEVLP